MNKPSGAIQKGDMVMVVRGRGCCGVVTKLGYTFIVKSTRIVPLVLCRFCKKRRQDIAAAQSGMEVHYTAGFELTRLLRIDPPALEKKAKRREPVLVRA
jgi:hypothetical protein